MRPASSPSAAVLGLLTGAAIAFGLVACAGTQRPEAPDVRRNEILQYLGQIQEWRREAGWSVDPAIPLNHPGLLKRSVPEIRVCPNDPDPDDATCQDTCKLKDAICDNAEKICDLADELGEDDSWASDKCKSAKASCKEATEKCCDCAAKEP
jgi:hypothetical protein